MKTRKPIGQILMEMGVIKKEQLAKALELQQESGAKLGETLIRMGAAKAEDITKALGEQFDFPVVDLDSTPAAAEAIDAVPKNVAKQHNILPVAKDGAALTVAISDPLDLYAMDNLRFILNSEIKCVLAPAESITEAIERYYGTEESTVDNMLQEFTDSDITTSETAEGGTVAAGAEDADAPIIRLVTLLISEALRSRASDIHIEPLQNRLRIRYRIDGVCQEIDSPPKRLQGAIISRVKIMAGIDIAEKRRPTDGRIGIKINGVGLDLRVSCLPATNGESVVMRLLRKESILINLQELGFHEDDYKRFLSIIKRPNGIFLVTGPTGSGKTTTLYAALNELNRPDKKIITAENPVEYNLSGVNQAEVKEKIGLTFGAILRSMLRQAPNVILVGEIRDKETAEIAVQAALTGHLVFSTLHTNDAPSAITRLIDIGVKPFLVASAVQAIMAQRLVRCICEQCKEPAEP
ncbi:MAG: type II/IV secretion system protein, partial [Planctomycetes bacterium]|nr:type II/IV secretion system protein [Planctomycetota bacterium]